MKSDKHNLKMETIAVVMSAELFDEIMTKFHNFDLNEEQELRTNFMEKLRTQFCTGSGITPIEVETQTLKQFNEVYTPLNFALMQVYADFQSLTFKNLGPLNCLWLQELHDTVKRLYPPNSPIL